MFLVYFSQGKEAIEHLSFLAKCDTDKVKKAAALSVSSFGKILYFYTSVAFKTFERETSIDSDMIPEETFPNL